MLSIIKLSLFAQLKIIIDMYGVGRRQTIRCVGFYPQFQAPAGNL